MLGVGGRKEGERRRLREALEAKGRPRSAELGIVRSACQAAIGGHAFEQRPVEDAAGRVRDEEPDGTQLRHLRAREALRERECD